MGVVQSEGLPVRTKQIRSIYRPHCEEVVVHDAERALADVVQRVGTDVGDHHVVGVIREVRREKYAFSLGLILLLLRLDDLVDILREGFGILCPGACRLCHEGYDRHSRKPYCGSRGFVHRLFHHYSVFYRFLSWKVH